MDTMVQKLSPRPNSSARFSVYLVDKGKVRVGQDIIELNNVGPGETVRFQATVSASANPVSLSVQDTAQAAKPILLTVNSTPQGAMLRLDGVDVGATPRIINVVVGKHTLTFIKDGFTAGNFPLEISPQDVSGGTVSYELGSSAFDSIELRDGSVLNGDLVSVSGMDLEIRVGGCIQHIDRNKIKGSCSYHGKHPSPTWRRLSHPVHSRREYAGEYILVEIGINLMRSRLLAFQATRS